MVNAPAEQPSSAQRSSCINDAYNIHWVVCIRDSRLLTLIGKIVVVIQKGFYGLYAGYLSNEIESNQIQTEWNGILL